MSLGENWWAEWVTWFNTQTPDEYRRHGVWEYRAKQPAVASTIKVGCLENAMCSWQAIVFPEPTPLRPPNAFFERRIALLSSGVPGPWQDIPGSVVVGFSLLRAMDGINITKQLTAYFAPATDSFDDLAFFGVSSLPGACAQRRIFFSEMTVTCPHNCVVANDDYSNSYQAHLFPGCAKVEPTAPGSFVMNPGPLGCNRTDCSGDCGGGGSGTCLTSDEYSSLCQDTSLGDPWIVAETNTLLSAFDGLFPVRGPVSGSDAAGWSTASADAPPVAYLNCEVIGTAKYWRAGFWEDGYVDDGVSCRAEGLFEALPNGCPPSPMTITSSNATIWRMGVNCAGVTSVTMQVSYL